MILEKMNVNWVIEGRGVLGTSKPQTRPLPSFLGRLVHYIINFRASCDRFVLQPLTMNVFKNTESSQQLSSRDRPQHPFLAPLTLNPTWTLACICVGASIVQSWWAGQIRHWWLDLSIQGTDEEKRMQRAFHDSKKLMVRVLPPTTDQNYPNLQSNKIDILLRVGSNILGIFCDIYYPYVTRGAYFKVLTIFLDYEIYAYSKQILWLQSRFKDISVGAIDINRYGVYASLGSGYSCTRLRFYIRCQALDVGQAIC